MDDDDVITTILLMKLRAKEKNAMLQVVSLRVMEVGPELQTSGLRGSHVFTPQIFWVAPGLRWVFRSKRHPRK